jgi:hypothetical protein
MAQIVPLPPPGVSQEENSPAMLRDAADADGADGAAPPEVGSPPSANKKGSTKVGWVSVPREDNAGVEKEATEDDEGTSPAELLARIDRVRLRPDYLLERIGLESNMGFTILKTANFFVYLIHFLLAMYEFCPAADLSMVHRQISEHFLLSTIDSKKTFNQIYDYMETFEHANEEVMPTSYHFWCEKRYDELTWNTHLGVPEHKCLSPRQGALGAPHYDEHNHHNHGISWLSWSQSQASDSHGSASASSGHGSTAAHSSTSDSHGSANASSSHASTSDSHGSTRRLGALVTQEIRDEVQLRKLAGYELDHTETDLTHTCHDFDDLLEEIEHIPGITCANSASWVCDLEAGLLVCELSCGYCPPFEYSRTRKFEKPMLSILPVVVFQTRMPWIGCQADKYASTYNKQTTNPNLVILPTLDGERNDDILRCVDREAASNSDWAHESIDCPKGYCEDDKFKDTPKNEFHGMTVYPKMLIEPHKDVMGMRNIEWLDGQTSMVAFSTMIYTEDLEIFTSVTIEFNVDNVGKITASKKLQSYKEFHSDAKDKFVIEILIVLAFSGIGILHSVYCLVISKRNREFANFYELLSRATLFGFTMYFWLAWQKLKPMHDEFDELLHSFLDVNGAPETLMEELAKTSQKFFEVKTHIYEENKWVETIRITAFIMLYLQFVQIILYMNAHPRMALLTRTLVLAWDNIVHFFALFILIFLMLAYMVHWLLGGDLFEVFGSFSQAFMSQTRMIFGEWIYSAGVDELHGVWLTMYWIWAATFMLLVFFTLLNFFLAIIVDAFVVVKEQIEKQVTECSFPYDCYDAFASSKKFYTKGWPSRASITKICEKHVPMWEGDIPKTSIEIDDDQDIETPSMPALELATLFGSNKKLAAFLSIYVTKIPDILLPPATDDPVDDAAEMSPQAKRKQKELARDQKKLFKGGSEAAMTKFVRSITLELNDNQIVDWDTAAGRLSCMIHRELARNGSIDA